MESRLDRAHRREVPQGQRPPVRERGACAVDYQLDIQPNIRSSNKRTKQLALLGTRLSLSIIAFTALQLIECGFRLIIIRIFLDKIFQ